MDDIPQESANLSLPPLIRLRVAMQGLDPIHLPPFAGSAWRGLLGHGLRQAACVTRARDCDGCLLQAHCVYPRVFEPLPPPGEDGRRFAAPPRPYLLNLDPPAGRDHAAGPDDDHARSIDDRARPVDRSGPVDDQAGRHAG